MTQEQIKEYTRVIGEFIGYKKDGYLWQADPMVVAKGFPKHIFEGDRTDGFKFHESYDLIRMAFDVLRDKSIAHIPNGDIYKANHWIKIADAMVGGTRSEAFTALAEAIIWYNENKQ